MTHATLEVHQPLFFFPPCKALNSRTIPVTLTTTPTQNLEKLREKFPDEQQPMTYLGWKKKNETCRNTRKKQQNDFCCCFFFPPTNLGQGAPSLTKFFSQKKVYLYRSTRGVIILLGPSPFGPLLCPRLRASSHGGKRCTTFFALSRFLT